MKQEIKEDLDAKYTYSVHNSEHMKKIQILERNIGDRSWWQFIEDEGYFVKTASYPEGAMRFEAVCGSIRVSKDLYHMQEGLYKALQSIKAKEGMGEGYRKFKQQLLKKYETN